MLNNIGKSALTALFIFTVACTSASANNTPPPYKNWFSDLTYPQFQFLKTRLKRYIKAQRNTVETLDDAADVNGRLVGAASNRGAFQNDPEYLAALNSEFSYITPENAGKWGLLQPNNSEEWDFSVLDSMLETAEANNQLFKAHALVWHIQLPSFVNDSLTAEDIRLLSETHINTTLTRYAGRIYAWDVVNEAIESDGSYRDSIWLQKFGTDYIANSFYAARAADPHAQLLYNDYDIERINPKSDGVYNMVKGLVEAGVPIDGVGFQMHLSAGSAPSSEQIIENLERFTALGLTVNISELDVRTTQLPWSKTTKLAIQQQVYHRVVDACLRVQNCEAVTTWGLSDRYSWIDSQFGPDDPLQLDEQYGRKPAYFGMIDGFVGLESDPLSLKPNLVANANFEAGTDGWQALGGEIKTVKSRVIKKYNNVKGRRILKSSARTETYQGPGYDLKALVTGNQTYDVSTLVSIKGRSKKENVNTSVQLQCEGEDIQYVTIATANVKRKKWSRLDGQFTTPDCNLEVATVYVEGPAAGTRLFVDNFSVRPQQLVVEPREDLGENILTNGDFELGFDTWAGYAAGSAELSEDAYNGTGSGFAFDRSNGFDGIATDLLGVVEPGKEYAFSGFGKIVGAGSDKLQITLFAACEDGPQYLFISTAQGNDTDWTYLTGDLTVPDCNATAYSLYFEGPQPGINFLVDDVAVNEVIPTVSVSNVIDSNFETGTEGWYAFGGALPQVTTDNPYEGAQSLLVTGRTATFEGPAYNITVGVVAGATYTLEAFTRIQGEASATVGATVVTNCGATGDQYNGAASVTASDSEWTQMNGSVTIPDCPFTQVQIYFESSSATADIAIDAVTLVGQNATGGGSNLAINGDFEGASVAPWTATGGEAIALTDIAFEGAQAIIATGRTAGFEGPGIDLVAQTEVNTSYAVTAQVRISAAADNVSVTLRTDCEGDGGTFFQPVGTAAANNTGWVELSGLVISPACPAVLQRFYFEGAAAGVDILVDNVVITAQ